MFGRVGDGGLAALRGSGGDGGGDEDSILLVPNRVAGLAVGYPAVREKELAAGSGGGGDGAFTDIHGGGVADVFGFHAGGRGQLAGPDVAVILEHDDDVALAVGERGNGDDKSVALERRAGRLVGDGRVRQFFPAVAEKFFALELEGGFDLAGDEVGKAGNAALPGRFRSVHEREGGEIEGARGLLGGGGGLRRLVGALLRATRRKAEERAAEGKMEETLAADAANEWIPDGFRFHRRRR